MKCWSYLLAAVTMLLLVVGCDSPLDYVPEDADFVIYGNTEALLDSKAWAIMTSSKEFKENFKELKKAIKVDEDDELSGKVAVWGEFKKDGPVVSGAVLTLDAGNAESIFKMIKKENDEKVKKTEVDDCDALIIKKYDDSIDFSVVMVDDSTLHFTFGGKPQIFERDGNDAADALDKSAVVAVAVKSVGDCEKLCKDMFGNAAPDLDGIGVAKVEVFADGSEIKASISVDISEVDD